MVRIISCVNETLDAIVDWRLSLLVFFGVLFFGSRSNDPTKNKKKKNKQIEQNIKAAGALEKTRTILRLAVIGLFEKMSPFSSLSRNSFIFGRKEIAADFSTSISPSEPHITLLYLKKCQQTFIGRKINSSHPQFLKVQNFQNIIQLI